MQQPPNYYSYISAWHHTHADMYPPNTFYYDQCNKTFCCPKQEKKLNHQQLKVPWQFEKKDNSSFDQNNHSYKVKNVESKRQFWLHALLCTCIFLFLFCDSIVMKGFISMINNTMDIDSKFICLCNFTTLATIVPLLWYDTTLTKVTNNFLSSHYLSCHKPPHMRSHQLWNTIK